MARPKKDGLGYFSFDTDFFYADKRIRKLHSRYGNDGIVMYIYLLTEIYRNGYFIRWDEDIIDDIIELHLTEGFIEQCLEYLVGRSLLVKRILSNSVTVITAPGIQKRYQEAVKRLKRQIFVDAEIWLLSNEETELCIKVTKNCDKSEKNTSKSEKNTSKSEKNTLKEKEKKIKESINTMCKTDVLALFESLWKLYPNKRGKGKISDAAKKRIFDIGYDEMSRAIERYLKDLEKDKDWRKPQNGSTFFNSGYVDYLDTNYEEQKHITAKSNNKFNQFQQQEYDFDALERELLGN